MRANRYQLAIHEEPYFTPTHRATRAGLRVSACKLGPYFCHDPPATFIVERAQG
jgi:hypothetical protein